MKRGRQAGRASSIRIGLAGGSLTDAAGPVDLGTDAGARWSRLARRSPAALLPTFGDKLLPNAFSVALLRSEIALFLTRQAAHEAFSCLIAMATLQGMHPRACPIATMICSGPQIRRGDVSAGQHHQAN